MNTLKQTLNVVAIILLAGFFVLTANSAWANETGLPHNMTKITGQEDFIHIWTLGTEGVGDEQDKLVTVDVNPNSAKYGKVVSSVSVGGETRHTTWGSPWIDNTYGVPHWTPARYLSLISTPTLPTRN
jgi:hypothetical protein